MGNIIAGDTLDLRFDAEAAEFRPDENLPGPTFTIRVLSYFDILDIDLAAELLGPDTKPSAQVKARVKKGLELGLVSIDGDTDKAKAFSTNPTGRRGTRLYQAILMESWGN